MYYYIIDPGKISQRDFERVQNQLYSSVSEFRINGEMVRATGLRTINQLVESAFQHGVSTLVAVGGDDTLQEVINAVGDRDLTIGFIPLGPTEIAETLGIKDIPQAAKTVAARRVEELDLGIVNHNLFFTKLIFGLPEAEEKSFLNYRYLQSLTKLPEFEIKISADGQYQASLKVIGGIIINSRNSSNTLTSSPVDGVLDILLLKQLSRFEVLRYRQAINDSEFEKIPGTSVLHLRKMEILIPEAMPLRLDSKTLSRTPANIEIRSRKLKIIVGRERKF